MSKKKITHHFACPECYQKELDHMAHDAPQGGSVARLLHDGHINRDALDKRLAALEKKVEVLTAKYIAIRNVAPEEDTRFEDIEL